jgi:hypothetical protein
MLAPADGPRRVLTFIILAVCSDIGGYFAGITLGRGGRHLMAPVISPKKTWEGLAGSAAATVAAGAILLPVLLHGYWWQGVIVGAAALGAAVIGDLAESMIKRDLDIKDMGSLLPGHGGILDRLDSLLLCAPVVWLLLSLFLKSLSGTDTRASPAPPAGTFPDTKRARACSRARVPAPLTTAMGPTLSPGQQLWSHRMHDPAAAMAPSPLPGRALATRHAGRWLPATPGAGYPPRRANSLIMSATLLSSTDQCFPSMLWRVRSGAQRSRSDPASAGVT